MCGPQLFMSGLQLLSLCAQDHGESKSWSSWDCYQFHSHYRQLFLWLAVSWLPYTTLQHYGIQAFTGHLDSLAMIYIQVLKQMTYSNAAEMENDSWVKNKFPETEKKKNLN